MMFAYPIFLVLLLALPFLAVYLLRSRRSRATLPFSDVRRMKQIRISKSLALRRILPILRLLVLALLIMALARPRTQEDSPVTRYTEGVDIIIALDVSSSMMAEDLDMPAYRSRREVAQHMSTHARSTRLDVAKQVVADFIDKRHNDRIGLVVFARDCFIRCPMTLDYGMLRNFLDGIQILMGGQMQDKTAIANSIARCTNRLRHSEAKSRVLIFLTDGVETFPGEFSQLTAAEMAKTVGVKIYTIGVGSDSVAPVRVDGGIFGEQIQFQPVEIDEETLTKIADITGGRYFRAKDRKSLEGIFQSIDSLEKSEIESEGHRRYNEKFAWFIIPALGLLLFEQILAHTRFRTLP